MLVRRYANVLERVALVLGGLDPLRNIRLRSAPLA
jgi:hypothetical protein